MKICFDIPEWALEGQMLSLYAGSELVAYKYNKMPVVYKDNRCSQCGKCCAEIGADFVFADKSGKCSYLEKAIGNSGLYECSLGFIKPIFCCFAPTESSNVKGCSITFKT